jgi:4-methyl-5(b-hydroxyethyl)-thiazole monophosphate biosynthesis
MTKALVILADGFEEIEALTIVDILRRSGVITITAGVSTNPITSARNVQLNADKHVNSIDCNDFDMIILPGGMPGAENIDQNKTVERLLQCFNKKEKYIAAICASPFILSNKGLLKDKKATSYPSFENQVNAKEYLDESVVVDGKIITSRGPATAAEFSFKLAELLVGQEKVEELKKAMLYT